MHIEVGSKMLALQHIEVVAGRNIEVVAGRNIEVVAGRNIESAHTLDSMIVAEAFDIALGDIEGSLQQVPNKILA